MPFVGHYEVLSELGDGGMGTVKLGRAPSGRLVVLKQPHRGDESLRDLLLDEARVGLRLKHPNIVETLDFFELEGRPVLVVAFVSGASLQDLRAFGPLPLPVVCRVGRQIAEALDSLHHAKDEQGRPLHILHRDVTPANIMLGHDGEARLIDLGIAKHDERRAEKTRTGYLRGTLRYMAPEIFDKGAYSPQSDLWALGVSLLDAALGRQAIPGLEGEVVARIIGGRIIDLHPGEKLDRRLEKALKKLLHANPKKRPKQGNEAGILFSLLEKELGATAEAAADAVRAAIGDERPFGDDSAEATELVVSRATAIYRGVEAAEDLPTVHGLPPPHLPRDTAPPPPVSPPRAPALAATAPLMAALDEELEEPFAPSSIPIGGGSGSEPTEVLESARIAGQVRSLGLDPDKLRDELNAELKNYLDVELRVREQTPSDAIQSYAAALRSMEGTPKRTPVLPQDASGPTREPAPPMSVDVAAHRPSASAAHLAPPPPSPQPPQPPLPPPPAALALPPEAPLLVKVASPPRVSRPSSSVTRRRSEDEGLIAALKRRPAPFAVAAGMMLGGAVLVGVLATRSSGGSGTRPTPAMVFGTPAFDEEVEPPPQSPMGNATIGNEEGDDEPRSRARKRRGKSKRRSDERTAARDVSLEELTKRMPDCWAPGRTRYFYYTDKSGTLVAARRIAEVPSYARKKVRCAE